MHDGLDDAVHVVVEEVRTGRSQSRNKGVSKLNENSTIEILNSLIKDLTNLIEEIDDLLLSLIRCYPVI